MWTVIACITIPLYLLMKLAEHSGREKKDRERHYWQELELAPERAEIQRALDGQPIVLTYDEKMKRIYDFRWLQMVTKDVKRDDFGNPL